jgi:hypothetical protein
LLLVDLNQRAFKKLPGNRRSAFEQLDRPALRALPAKRFNIFRWKFARVNIDYHVEFEGPYYSVPHALVQRVQIADALLRTLSRKTANASHLTKSPLYIDHHKNS